MPESNTTINDMLIEEGFAEKCEESFLSLMDHFRRESVKSQPASFNFDETLSAPYTKIWENCQDVDLNINDARRRLKQVFLKGPFSPLEMKVHAVSRGTSQTSANIEWNSVNSVLLDTEPQNPNDRLLVASFVSTNEAHDVLSLRDTTIMPNVRGMVGLMCLLFAPSAELRVNNQRTKITGALCGLGYDPATNEPYHPNDDVEVNFDAEFSLSDIELINKIRYWLNNCFCNDGGDDFPNALAHQAQVKDHLLKLLKRKRRYQNFTCPVKQFKWNALSPKYVISPSAEFITDDVVFKLHSFVVLEKKEPPSVLNEIRKNLLELYKIATCDIRDYTDGVCKLCNNILLRNRIAIQIHFGLPEHRENERKMFKANIEEFEEVTHITPMPKQSKSRTDHYGIADEPLYSPSRGRGRGRRPIYNNGYNFFQSSSGFD